MLFYSALVRIREGSNKMKIKIRNIRSMIYIYIYIDIFVVLLFFKVCTVIKNIW